MHKFKAFKKIYEKSVKSIQRFIDEPSDMNELAAWLMTTDASPYSYLQEGYAGMMSTAEGCDGLLATIHHAFYTKRVLAMVIDWSQHITIIDELGIISDIYTKSLNLRFISPKYAKKILGNSYYKQIVNIINSDVNNMLFAQSLKSDDEVYHDYLYGI